MHRSWTIGETRKAVSRWLSGCFGAASSTQKESGAARISRPNCCQTSIRRGGGFTEMLGAFTIRYLSPHGAPRRHKRSPLHPPKARKVDAIIRFNRGGFFTKHISATSILTAERRFGTSAIRLRRAETEKLAGLAPY